MKGCTSVIHVRLPDSMFEKAKEMSGDLGISEWVRGLIGREVGGKPVEVEGHKAVLPEVKSGKPKRTQFGCYV